MTLRQLKRRYLAEGKRLGYKKALNERYGISSAATRELTSEFDRELINVIYKCWMVELIDALGGDGLEYYDEPEMGLKVAVEENELSKQDVLSAMRDTMQDAVISATIENERYWREEYGIDDIERVKTRPHRSAVRAKIKSLIKELGI